jgi:hypothetical protein
MGLAPSLVFCTFVPTENVQETLRLLAFDCLVVDTQNVMSRTLDKRYGVSGNFFIVYPHYLCKSCFGRDSRNGSTSHTKK